MGRSATDSAIRLFKVLETGDPALAAEVVAAGFRNREAGNAPEAASRPGPAGVLASSAWMRAAFTGLRFPILDTGADEEGGRVYVRLRMQGRHTGAFVLFRDGRPDKTVPPTGREIDVEQIHVLTVRDGRVVGHEAVRDDVTMLGQLGVFPPRPAVAGRLAGWKLTGRDRRAAAEVCAQAAAAAQTAVASAA